MIAEKDHTRPFMNLNPIAGAFWILFPAFVLFLSNPGKLAGQCTDTADFSRWFEANGQGHWLLNSPRKVTNNVEIIPARPSFFVNDRQMLNVRFSFNVESQNSQDNDFIGFVVGYRNPYSDESNEYDFILFDWKAKSGYGYSHYAEEGFSLAAFHGYIAQDAIHDYFWGHNSTASNSAYEPLSFSFGDDKGWDVNQKYHVEVFYMETSIKILIDDELIFDIERCNQPGKIGFYTYSQYGVVFSNFYSRSSADIFASPTTICAGDTVFASLLDPNCTMYDPAILSWQWNWGDGETSINKPVDFHIYQAAGNYIMELVAQFSSSCSDTISTLITVQNQPEFDLGPDTSIHAGESITLTPGGYHPGWTYHWSTGSREPQITLNDLERDTTISLLVTSSLCQDYDEITIRVIHDTIPQFNIWVPNVFSPDGDGLNDIFQPETTEAYPDKYNLYIFDRWGTEIFRSSEPGRGWDGTYKGQPCQGDVYGYLISYQPADQFQTKEIIMLKGCFLLLR